jgi:hypothetical protein
MVTNGITGSPRGSISGRVLDETGAPLPDVGVFISFASVPHPDIASATDSAGYYELLGLASGSYVLRATADGFATVEAHVRLSSGHAERNFVLPSRE